VIIPGEAWSVATGGTEPGRPPRTPRPRRRRGRRLAALLALVLAVGLWWTRSEDPQGDVRALTDPETYREISARIENLLGDVAVRPEISEPHPVVVSPPPTVSATRSTPPIGQGESGSRLLPPVVVPEEDAAHGFAALQDDGVDPVAWSPCRPIRYVVNEEGGPDDFAATVRRAVGELSAATGLAFVDDGVTSEAPSAERGAYLPDRYGDQWAPVLIAVADPRTIPFLDGDTAGVAYTYRVRGLSSGIWHLVSGSVYLDREAFEFRGRAGGEPGWVPVLRHELGHLAGLDHLDDRSQLMNPVTSSAVRTYQAGDLTGLARLGRGACAPDV
jgi:hypothetical protein